LQGHCLAGSEQANLPGKALFEAGGSLLTPIQLVPRFGEKEDCSDSFKKVCLNLNELVLSQYWLIFLLH